jgi:hypothetical protein
MSASSAADKQSAATDKALNATQQQASTARSDLAPYRSAGTAALSRLRTLAGIGTPDENDPRYTDIKNQIIAGHDAAHQKQFGMSIFDPRSGLSAPGEKSKFDEMVNNSAAQQYASQYGNPAASTPGSGDALRKFQTSDLNADPVYQSGLQFGLGEGTKAIERRAAARGGYDSGATLKELTRFGNDYGSQKAGESYNRFRDWQNSNFDKLSGIAGMGSGATTVGVGAGANAGSNLASLYSGQGNANAAANIAQGNAFAGGANQFANLYGQNQMLQQLQGGGARTLQPNPGLTGAADLGAVA